MLVALVIGASASPVSLDSVNIGVPATEATHNLAGWTITLWSGCGWCGPDGNMRLIWGDGGESADPANNWASVTLDAGSAWATSIRLQHLDGAADDGFNVYVNGDLVGTYVADNSIDEWVLDTEFDISGGGYFGLLNVKLEATGTAWGGIGTFGQVAFNEIELFGDPWLDFVNVGSTGDAYLLGSWGPVEPDTHGGNWGNMGSPSCGVSHDGSTPSGALCDNKTRVIWEQGSFVETVYVPGSRAAQVTLINPEGLDGRTLVVRHLDGLADDSFSLQVRGENAQGKANTKWYTLGPEYSGEQDSSEDWHVTTFSLATDRKGDDIPLGDVITIKFRAEGTAWSGHQTWGQVAIDWVALVP